MAVGAAAVLYFARMFAITAFYHRYFSHRSFQTSRPLQLLFAIAGACSAQRGALWWAAHHRHHHGCADKAEDPHSPVQYGFWWSQIAWFTTGANFRTRTHLVRDLLKYPELRFLNRFDALVPVLLAVALFGFGEMIRQVWPGSNTSGAQMLVWGFFVSTVVLLHATGTINSLAHLWGSRRYRTSDNSRNNLLLALLTLGEGWHNNHHHFSGSARQGFFWWEIDITYYVLRLFEWTGLIWNLKAVPAGVRSAKGPPE